MKFPKWLRNKLIYTDDLVKTKSIISEFKLNTVCSEANCPNRLECFSKKIATFLALGNKCTRSCAFCSIEFEKNPEQPDEDEPKKIAFSVKKLGLKHVVITMVSRDDLNDGGAAHIAKIIKEIRHINKSTSIEVLTSDFLGNTNNLDIVLNQRPEVFNHNIETVKSLTKKIRNKANYETSLLILKHAKKQKKTKFIKSGLMLGLGEQETEVEQTIIDLYKIGCDIITIGQYLKPNNKKISVKDFILPNKFKQYENFGKKLGIKFMYCSPFVRSSYNAKNFI